MLVYVRASAHAMNTAQLSTHAMTTPIVSAVKLLIKPVSASFILENRVFMFTHFLFV
jgi:hypothetical protein